MTASGRVPAIVRQETEADYPAVYALIRDAFVTAEHSDGKEHDLVAALRDSRSFVPALSLVAESEGRIVGHVLFTEVSIGNMRSLALAPLAVSLEYRSKGIGAALVTEGHRIARKLGYAYSVVLGDPAYYARFGYRPACEFGIRAPFDVCDAYFMALRLRSDAPLPDGTVRYDAAFGI
ncbi:GNAT family N-acetyltransferase [uncultured Alistipes sp.]|uniref:GNAT family N-acetyltransferase n=1 Tax=uncultured Alistipes sp. TaxID=538949 RepID=UPI00272AF2F3|nr:N-acetyltransferase [uncultured Alistipes sp.]